MTLRPKMNAATVLLPFLCLPSTTNGALLRAGENAGHNENDMISIVDNDKGRHLLSLTPDSEECLYKNDVMLRNEELGQLFNLMFGDSRLWKLPLEQPFCNAVNSTVPVDGVAKCDVRRLSRDIIDFDSMKSICESDDVGGEFIEFDMLVSESWQDSSPKREIKHIPMCIDRSACPIDIETVSLLFKIWDNFGSLPYVVRSDGCDEVADDNFFVKVTEGEPVVMTCEELSEMTRNNMFPAWMSNKHPCEKTWSPAGQPGTARTVCPVTCKQEMCADEDPERVFLKEISTPTTKTCRWLSNQDSTKQKKLCGRIYYRKEGFPSIPSAYSACPDTCSQFD